MNESKKLKDISLLIGSGITPRRDNESYWENGTIPWLKTEQLGEKNIYDTNEKISELALDETSIKLFPVNTLSMAMYGEGRTRGNVSILKKEMTTNQACCNIVLDSKKADYEYVYYFLKTQYNQLRSLSSGIRKNLNSNDIKEFEIRLPAKVSEQQKIAAVLSALDEKIELNQRINAELESMAKTLYDYWFVQFDFPNEKSKPYKSAGGKMVWNEELKRDVPVGWEVKKFADWIESDKCGDWGSDEPKGNYVQKVSCIRGTDINGLNVTDTCNPPTRFILEKNSHKILNSHDLIIEISGGAPKQSTGRLGYITNATLKRFENPLICSNFCKAISIKDKKFLYNFVYHWNMLYDNDVFFGYEGKTSGIKNLLFDTFVNSHWTVVPPSELVDKFYDFMQEIQAKKQTALLESQTLTELRDWLLPMLMNGQVTVKT